MREDLVDIQKVMKLLGYSDERSMRKWCKSNNIPIVCLGLRKYITQQLLTEYIDNQLVIFVKGNKSDRIISESDSNKIVQNTNQVGKASYKPENDLVSKSIAKYESRSKSKTSIQRPS